MKALRLLPGLLLSTLACAGSKTPATDDAPVTSPADDDDPADDATIEPGDTTAAHGGQACSSDDDCVPAQCCHPDSCVPASQAPDCSDQACTLNCQDGTMDCGGGHCACQDGTCTAIIQQHTVTQTSGGALEEQSPR